MAKRIPTPPEGSLPVVGGYDLHAYCCTCGACAQACEHNKAASYRVVRKMGYRFFNYLGTEYAQCSACQARAD
jgi:polyferredoxin